MVDICAIVCEILLKIFSLVSQLDEILNDFVIRKDTTVDTVRNECLKLQANGHYEDFGGSVNELSQHRVSRK